MICGSEASELSSVLPRGNLPDLLAASGKVAQLAQAAQAAQVARGTVAVCLLAAEARSLSSPLC